MFYWRGDVAQQGGVSVQFGLGLRGGAAPGFCHVQWPCQESNLVQFGLDHRVQVSTAAYTLSDTSG